MRIRTWTVALAVVALSVASCGDDGGKDTSAAATAFCGMAAPIQALAGVSDKADDAKAVQTVFTAAETALGSMSSNPPAAIKEDLTTVTSTFTAANTVLKANAYSYDKAAAANAKAIEALDSATFTKATDNIQAWATKNCAGFTK